MQNTEYRQPAPTYPFGDSRAPSTLDEERQEALESVLAAMAAGDPDPDRTAACTRLLRHLVRSSARN